MAYPNTAANGAGAVRAPAAKQVPKGRLRGAETHVASPVLSVPDPTPGHWLANDVSAEIRQSFRLDGGGERIVSQINRVLQQNGFDVTLIARKWNGIEAGVTTASSPRTCVPE